MEIIDVLNNHGEPTGESKDRSAIHRDGDLHLAVEIWLLNNKNQLLIQKRSIHKDSYPNLWEVSCSGHVDSKESSLQAAKRELKEELGLSVQDQELIFLKRFFEPSVLNETYVNNEFKDLYLIHTNKTLDQFHFPEEEISALRWIDLSELTEKITHKDPRFVPHPVGYPILFKYIHEAKNPT